MQDTDDHRGYLNLFNWPILRTLFSEDPALRTSLRAGGADCGHLTCQHLKILTADSLYAVNLMRSHNLSPFKRQLLDGLQNAYCHQCNNYQFGLEMKYAFALRQDTVQELSSNTFFWKLKISSDVRYHFQHGRLSNLQTKTSSSYTQSSLAKRRIWQK
jgi:hypothetical protein